MREQTGCDAVMIGRGALGNPWLFARLREVCAGRPDPGPPTLEERLAVFRRHVDLIEQLQAAARARCTRSARRARGTRAACTAATRCACACGRRRTSRRRARSSRTTSRS